MRRIRLQAYGVLQDSDAKIHISRDVFFVEGDEINGVVELGFDPTDESPTAEEDDARVPKEVKNLSEADLERKDPPEAN